MSTPAAETGAIGGRWFRLLGAAALAVLWWRTLCVVQQVQWNAPRLTPSFALAAGLDFYGTRSAGPFLGWVYGPVFPLYLLPAALLPNLSAAFALAWTLNLLAFLIPAWLVARAALPRGPAVSAALLAWGALSLGGEVSQLQFYFLHVDTLCVGLSLLASWALVRAIDRPQSHGWVHGAAAASALAVWTKQPAVAVPVILALWLVAGRERRLAGRYFVWSVAYAGLLGVAFMTWFGSEQILFNLVWIHLHNPVRPDERTAFVGQLLGSSPVWVAAGLALALVRRWNPPPAQAPAARRISGLLLWLAVGSLPLGSVAVSKVAGGWNSLHSLNYALLWLALALARSVAPPARRLPARLALGLAVALPLATAWLVEERAELPWRPAMYQADQLALAREQAGRLYLPWNPLVTLITDHRIYPFDDALLCLERVGLEPPPAAVRREIPRHALVVYPEPAQSRFALRYLGAAPASPP